VAPARSEPRLARRRTRLVSPRPSARAAERLVVDALLLSLIPPNPAALGPPPAVPVERRSILHAS